MMNQLSKKTAVQKSFIKFNVYTIKQPLTRFVKTHVLVLYIYIYIYNIRTCVLTNLVNGCFIVYTLNFIKLFWMAVFLDS